MSQRSLDYHKPLPTDVESRLWGALGGIGLIAPFAVVPLFLIVTPLLQDELINGDGRSWQRATLWTGVPAVAITLAGLAGALWTLTKVARLRRLAVFATIINVLTLALIVSAIVSASAL